MTARSPHAVPNWVQAQAATDAKQYTQWLDVVDFEKLTVMLNAAIVGSPGDLLVTVEASIDGARELNLTNGPTGLISGDYDKLIDKAGADAPVAVITVSAAPAFRVFSKSPEDGLRSIRLAYISSSTTPGSVEWIVDVGYVGIPRS